ncbi:MAG TPA: hypothetical protein VFU03_06400 [Gemmatimonadales bacterium]|nr:hypothetical protein [Gemmatimonadales bacterium]
MTTPVSCDENGFVRGFPYHDGFFDGSSRAKVAKKCISHFVQVETSGVF